MTQTLTDNSQARAAPGAPKSDMISERSTGSLEKKLAPTPPKMESLT